MARSSKKSRKHNTSKYSSSQLLNFARDSYLERTSRPIYAFMFLLPFMAIYEIGTSLINTDELNRSQIRVVAFVWLQDMLNYAGFNPRFAWIAIPMAAAIILLALQITSKTSWKVRFTDMAPMAGECVMLAVPLIVLSLLLNRSAANPQAAWSGGGVVAAAAVSKPAAVGIDRLQSEPVHGPRNTFTVSLVTGIGAGIYEELVFRLILISLLMLILQDVAGMEHLAALIVAVLLSAGLFSAHHYIIFLHGRFDQTLVFDWSSFVFRTVAGVYFAGLFAVRGFGITAGTHAFYDILAAILNVLFFAKT
jgi:hypothetical protein